MSVSFPPPQSDAVKWGNESLPHKVLGIFQGAVPVLGPGAGQLVCSSSIHHRSVVLMCSRPIGLKSQMFCGLVSQTPVLKAGVPNLGYESLASEGEGPCFEFLPDVGGLVWVRIMVRFHLSLSYPLSRGFPPSVWCYGVVLTVLRFFPPEKLSVSMGGDEFRICLCCLLRFFLKILFLYLRERRGRQRGRASMSRGERQKQMEKQPLLWAETLIRDSILGARDHDLPEPKTHV